MMDISFSEYVKRFKENFSTAKDLAVCYLDLRYTTSRSFTPLNKGNAFEICKAFGLFECPETRQCGFYGHDENGKIKETKAIHVFGIDERAAWCYPLVIIFEDSTVFLNDDLYEEPSYGEGGKIKGYYLDTCSFGHGIRSVERFIKYLGEGIDFHRQVAEKFAKEHPEELNSNYKESVLETISQCGM